MGAGAVAVSVGLSDMFVSTSSFLAVALRLHIMTMCLGLQPEQRCSVPGARAVGGVAGEVWLTCCSQCIQQHVTRLRGCVLSSLSCASFLSRQQHVSCQNLKALARMCTHADVVKPANRVIKHKTLCMHVSGPCHYAYTCLALAFVCLGLFLRQG